MILVDTDVLVIYHIFMHDKRYNQSKLFLEGERNLCTSIYNLLELYGILNTAGKKVDAGLILEGYLKARDIEVVYPTANFISSEDFWSEYVSDLTQLMDRGIRYGDAKILWTAESNLCEGIVTWNTKHYLGKTELHVKTPEEAIEREI